MKLEFIVYQCYGTLSRRISMQYAIKIKFTKSMPIIMGEDQIPAAHIAEVGLMNVIANNVGISHNDYIELIKSMNGYILDDYTLFDKIEDAIRAAEKLEQLCVMKKLRS